MPNNGPKKISIKLKFDIFQNNGDESFLMKKISILKLSFHFPCKCIDIPNFEEKYIKHYNDLYSSVKKEVKEHETLFKIN